MQYVLMDLDNGNLVGGYASERDALRDVVEAMRQYGEDEVKMLALGGVDANGHHLLAKNDELVTRARDYLRPAAARG